MSKWMLLRKGADYNTISKQYKIDPLVARIMINRGIDSKEKMDMFLNGNRSSFHNPLLMQDMQKAVDIVSGKIENRLKIRIIGDYDGDGVCSETILLRGLSFLGAVVDGIIPHRIKDGYGLNMNMIEEAYNDGIDTIITCDNGISAYKEIEKASELGMTVIVTDHHEVPYDDTGKQIVPPAAAVVDPKRRDCSYPYKDICGAFVAYKFVEALISKKEYSLLPGKEKLFDELLQFAALATVTDIMELRDENRCLVKEGLKLIKNTKSIGLKALLEVLGVYGKEINVYTLGFMIGPCINAAGRIDSAEKALDLFMSEESHEAVSLASELKSMNDSRKTLTEKATNDAIKIINSEEYLNDKVLVIYLEDCHESVAGIVAGRIREKYFKPALIITDSEGVLKGSARSIPSYNMYEELSKVSDLFIKYGGHPQAAGFSLKKENLQKLREQLNCICTLKDEDFMDIIKLDADAPFSYCDGKFLDNLAILEPFGNGNESPVFARKDLRLIKGKMLGNSGKVGKYTVIDTDGFRCELTLFSKNEEFKIFLSNKFGENEVEKLFGNGTEGISINAAYYPSWNEYMGRKTVQYIMTDFC